MLDALTALSPKARAIVVLRYWEDLSVGLLGGARPDIDAGLSDSSHWLTE